MTNHTKNRISVTTFLLLSFAFLSLQAQKSKKLFVADRKVSCYGIAAGKCLQIKEKPQESWEPFYSNIEGFEYEEGYEYKILVNKVPVINAPADAPSMRYKLAKIISRKKTSFISPMALGGTKWILRAFVADTQTFRFPDTLTYMTLNLKEGKVEGRAICNNFFGSVKAFNGKIQFNSIGSTKMFCQGQVFEDEIFKTLREAISYIITDEAFIIRTNGTNQLIFHNQ